MKCDVHHEKNPHPKTCPIESDRVQQFQFQTSQFFLQYNQVSNVYLLAVVCGDTNLEVNQTKLGFHTVYHNTDAW